MLKPQASVQLWSVREELARDLPGTLAQLAAMGFKNVELAGLHGRSAAEFAKLLSAAGLQAPSLHGDLPVGPNRNKVIEDALALGAKYIITGGPHGGWNTAFQSSDSIKREAAAYNEAAVNAAAHGLRVGFHNHDLEIVDVEGGPAYRTFLQQLAPEVLWTIDIYWVKVGGRDPAAVVAEAGARTRILHIKDGSCVKGEPMLPAGQGVVDIPAAVAAASAAEYLVVELDAYAGVMMDAVKASLAYLQAKKFVR